MLIKAGFCDLAKRATIFVIIAIHDIFKKKILHVYVYEAVIIHIISEEWCLKYISVASSSPISVHYYLSNWSHFDTGKRAGL